MYTLQCGAFEAVGLSWDIVSRAMRVMVPDWDGTVGTWHTGTTDICRVLRIPEDREDEPLDNAELEEMEWHTQFGVV